METGEVVSAQDEVSTAERFSGVLGMFSSSGVQVPCIGGTEWSGGPSSGTVWTGRRFVPRTPQGPSFTTPEKKRRYCCSLRESQDQQSRCGEQHDPSETLAACRNEITDSG